MSLALMSPGGRWLRPPHNAPPVYVPAKQLGDKLDSHWKRLIGDGWIPIEDPRLDDGTPVAGVANPAISSVAAVEMTPREVSMQVQIDQLTALVQQLIAQNQKEQDHASTPDDADASGEAASHDRRSRGAKSAVR